MSTGSRAAKMPRLELIAVGRAGVDFYGEQIGGRLEDMGSFAKYVGGSPTNTAIGASRLGLSSGLLTRVGDDHMGRFIREELVREGVDVHGVRSDPERLTALVILGIRDRERFPLIFYRENCADMALVESDIDPGWVEQAGAVLINGTHLSRPGVRAASLAAARLARRGGGRVVFDVDYRPVLWGLAARDRGEDRYVPSAETSQTLQEALPLCDLIVGTEEEMRILGGEADTCEALATIRRRTAALLVCKLGARGCVALEGEIPRRLDAAPVVAGFPIEVFNVLGAGDAFMAGFLRGWLRDEPLDRCCRWANACGALVVSRHGCAPAMPSWEELQEFLARTDLPFRLREDRALAQSHWATTRARRPPELFLLDVSSQASDAAPRHLPSLALDALNRAAGSDPRFGILLEGEAAFDALARAAELPYWVGRTAPDAGAPGASQAEPEFREWPVGQTAYCRWAAGAEGVRGLERRFIAARGSRHELMVEIVPPAGPAGAASPPSPALHDALRDLYDAGIRPDWWVMPADADGASWRAIAGAIAHNDPRCRGVLIRAASSETLARALANAAPFVIVRGFVAQVACLGTAVRDLEEGRIGREAATDAIAAEMAVWARAWRRVDA